MEDKRVWLILGSAEGLGPPAVKYLRSRKQSVIPVNILQGLTDWKSILPLTARYGPVDFIINNSNYGIFHKAKPDIAKSIETTTELLCSLMPYLRRQPEGCIINIPPQLCLANLPNTTSRNLQQAAMDIFLSGLHRNLLTLNCCLRFLEPGERLV